MSLSPYPRYRDAAPPLPLRVPEQWHTVAFKRLASVQNGADYKHIESVDGVPVYGSGGPFAYATESMFEGDSVLLGRKGTVDRPLFVSGRFWCVDTMFWTQVAAGSSPKYVYYLASTIPFGLYSTNTALPSMAKGDLENHPVVAPPLNEQVAISCFLDRETSKIDTLIAEQERLIALLREKRQVVISHAVTKGLNPNVPMKDSGVEWLGQVPEHWDLLRLKQIVAADGIQMGPFGGMLTDILDEDTGYKLIGQENTISGDLSRGSRWLSRERFVALAEYHVAEGDVLITRKGSLGNAHLVRQIPQPSAIDSDTVRIRIDETRMSPEFLVWLLHEAPYVAEQVNRLKRGAILPGLNTNTVSNLLLAVPPVNEQHRLLEYLVQRSEEYGATSNDSALAIALLRERRTALITAAVTGQIDVRGLVETAA